MPHRPYIVNKLEIFTQFEHQMNEQGHQLVEIYSDPPGREIGSLCAIWGVVVLYCDPQTPEERETIQSAYKAVRSRTIKIPREITVWE